MKKLILPLAVLGGLLAISGVAQAQGSVSRGARIVERNCAQCHSVGARGESPNREAPPFRDLGKRYPIEMLEEALAEGILTRHPAMPQFRFTVPEIDDIIVYLNSIQIERKVLYNRR